MADISGDAPKIWKSPEEILAEQEAQKNQELMVPEEPSVPTLPVEERLDIISDLTRDLERPEFNRLVDALKSVFEARQKLKGVKTNEEKDMKDITEAEKSLYLEVDK